MLFINGTLDYFLVFLFSEHTVKGEVRVPFILYSISILFPLIRRPC